MALTFYYLSGSPFSWKVWLALEHKQLRYDLKVLSADAGDLKTPEFLSLNPRGKVPVIVDDGFVLSESSAIIEYLDEKNKGVGAALWPADPQARALARRIASEGDSYIYPQVRKLVVELLMRKDGSPDLTHIADAKASLERELATLAAGIDEAFIAGPEACAADYAVYPFLAVLNRVATRKPEYRLSELLPAGVVQWMGRVESLPFFSRTTPPHWRPS